MYKIPVGKWYPQPTVGESPAPCSQCTFSQVDKKRVVLFGGSQLNNNCVPNNVYILDIKSWVSWHYQWYEKQRGWGGERGGGATLSPPTHLQGEAIYYNYVYPTRMHKV